MIALLMAQIIIINSYAIAPSAPIVPNPGNILQEDNSKLFQQDSVSTIKKEFSAAVPGNILMQDGTSKILQQDGTSKITTQ